MNYTSYLEDKYKPLTEEEYSQIEQPEKSIEEMNEERKSLKIKDMCDICEPNQPGFKFRRNFEDMRKKLRVDEKIQIDLGLKLENTKLDENALKEEQNPKFIDLGEDYDRKDKFRTVFRNSYHNIIISFFNMLIALKKNKQDFALVFRFFGHNENEIQQFIYEYNCFIDCLHPRYCGDYGFNKVKYEIEKDKRDYKIYFDTQEFMGVSYRGNNEQNEKLFFGTLEHPPLEEIEGMRDNIESFYENKSISPTIGYNEIYLTFMDKLTKNCTFILMDDYSNYINSGNKNGKLLLIDPYDIDTLQIFFDTDLNKYPEKIDVIDIVTKKTIPLENCLNKFVVNVEPYRAIIDINYFNHKIEECVNNRKNELLKMEGKEVIENAPDENLNIEEEIKKIPGDLYLKMTVLPLLHNALNMCELVRPSDPIAFISNFMLINKGTSKTMEDILKDLPKYSEIEDMGQELLMAAGEYSREEHNDEGGEEQAHEEEKKNNNEN